MSKRDKTPGAWVVDCSAFMSLVFSDEDAEQVERLLVEAVNGRVRLLVPALFWYEVGNVLLMAVRKKRISAGEADGALYRFTELPIETDAELGAAVALRMNSLASRHALTMYDAAYFELADRHSACLLTADKKLLALRGSFPWIRASVKAG